MACSQLVRVFLTPRIKRQFGGGTLPDLEARLSYNRADHVRDSYSLRTPPAAGMTAGGMATNVDRRTVRARLGVTWAWDDLELLVGADAQRNSHRTRSSMGVEDAFRQQPCVRDASFSQVGVFSELSWARRDDQRLIGGLRLD